MNTPRQELAQQTRTEQRTRLENALTKAGFYPSPRYDTWVYVTDACELRTVEFDHANGRVTVSDPPGIKTILTYSLAERRLEMGEL